MRGADLIPHFVAVLFERADVPSVATRQAADLKDWKIFDSNVDARVCSCANVGRSVQQKKGGPMNHCIFLMIAATAFSMPIAASNVLASRGTSTRPA